MEETLFPERQRCKTCHKALGKNSHPEVLFGLYCSAKCAGIAEPPVSAVHAPRECSFQRDDGTWSFKRRYRSKSELPDRIKNDPSATVYWCQSCGRLHTGHSRVDLTESSRRLVSRSDLQDFLVKQRGKATRKQVAEVAKIRPIRLRELEEGTGPVDIDALFAVLRVYRVKLAIAFNAGS